MAKWTIYLTDGSVLYVEAEPPQMRPDAIVELSDAEGKRVALLSPGQWRAIVQE